MARTLTDEEIEKGIAAFAKEKELSTAAATRRLCGIGLVRFRALQDYAAKQEKKPVKAKAPAKAKVAKLKKERAATVDKLAKGIGTSPSTTKGSLLASIRGNTAKHTAPAGASHGRQGRPKKNLKEKVAIAMAEPTPKSASEHDADYRSGAAEVAK